MRDPYSPSDGGLSIAFSMIDRAIKDGLTLNRFGKEETKLVLDFFFQGGPEECVYCGNPKPERWDHLIPINDGGETIIGNIVPACQPCDDSKQDTNFEKWMFGNSPKSPKSRKLIDIDKRIKKLKQYMLTFQYQPRPLISRLSNEEYDQYQQLLKKVKLLRHEIKEFIAIHKNQS